MSEFDAFGALELDGWSDEAVARSYAGCFATAAAQCVPAFVARVGAGPDCRALDMCCGHGVIARGLVDAGARVTALDFSPAMLELARRAVPEAEIVEGNAMALPFRDDSFDAVTIGFGMPHIPEPQVALSEAKRVLRPGGRLAYTVWHDDPALSVVGHVFAAIREFGDPAITLPPGPDGHIRAKPEFSLPEMAAAGFSEAQIETIDSGWNVDDPGAPFDYFRDGTVRGGALLRPQPKENQRLIRRAICDAVISQFGDSGPWKLPVPAAMVSGVA